MESLGRRTLFNRAIQVIKDEGVWLFFVKAFDFLCLKLRMLRYRMASAFLRIFASRAIERIKNFRSEDPEEVFDFVWSFCLGAMRPMQLREEFIGLLRTFKQRNPKYIMEIGTAGGEHYFAFANLPEKML